jgi:hypothetical protein
MERITPDKIYYHSNLGTNLEINDVFVFGSNLSGIHGAGAAKFAFSQLGYPWKKGIGLNIEETAYAIPTKDKNIKTLPIVDIQYYVAVFLEFTTYYKDKRFLVTEIGCGLAGYSPEDIAPLFKDAKDIENVHLPKRFWEILNDKSKKS